MKFALNAQPLPNDPSKYVADVAYKSDVSDDFINKGITSATFIETAKLNTYLYELSVAVEILLENNIPYLGIFKNNRYVTYDVQDGDIILEQNNVLHSKDGNLYNVKEEATREKNGLIKKENVTFEPPDIPIATQKIKGLIKPEDVCLRDKFIEMDVVCASFDGTAKHGLYFMFGDVEIENDTIASRISTTINYYGITSYRDAIIMYDEGWL